MEKEKTISIRRFEYSDIDGIVELLNRVFKPKFTRDWWRWKYEFNPNGFWGQDGDIWVAESEGKIVGHYAVIPEKFKFHLEAKSIAQSVDTATHPNYRGMGIFSTLAKKTYAFAKNRYPFLVGFPSGMAYKGFQKFGWKNLCPIPQYTKILNYDALTKRKFNNSLYRGSAKFLLKTYDGLTVISESFSLNKISGSPVEIQEVESFPNEIDAFWARARSSYSIVMERTVNFLNWRFSKHFGSYKIFICRSNRDKNIVGYIVLRKSDYAIDIVDLITLPNEDEAMSQLVNEAIKYGRAAGVDSIRCWFPKWNRQSTLLRQKGFVSPKSLRLGKTYVPQFIFYNLSPDEQGSNINEWYFTYADSDYA